MSDPTNPSPPPLPQATAPQATAPQVPVARSATPTSTASPTVPALGQSQGRAARRFHLDSTCPHCGVALDLSPRHSGRQSCQACRRPFEAVFFDPPPIPSRVTRLSEAGPRGGQPCAAHEGNLAVTHCGRCGVFICTLCRIEIETIEICPSCYQRQRQAGELIPMRLEFQDYRGQALSLGTISIILFFIAGFLLGPLAIFLGVKGLKQGRDMGEDSDRKALIAGIALGALGTVLSLAFFIFAFYNMFS